jgi:hypothetical protein
METKVVELKINTNLDKTNSDVNKLSSNLKNASGSAKDLEKSISRSKGANFNQMGDAVGELSPRFAAARTAVTAFNAQLLVLVANPIGIAIVAIVTVLGSLYAIFKDFQPLVDKVEQSMAALGAVFSTIKGAFFDVLTGSKSLTEAFGGLGNKASTAAKQTMELVRAQQDLDDVIIQNTVTTAKLESQINRLNVQAKNRNLTESQKIELLQKAEKLENKKFIIDKAQADESLRIARNAFIIKGKLNQREAALIDTNLIKAKEAAEAKGVLIDDEFKKLADAINARTAIDDKATVKLEKNQNKQDAIFEKQEAKREAQQVAAQQAREKREATEKANQDKALADRKAYLQKANLTEEEFENIKIEKANREREEKKQQDELDRLAAEKKLADDKARGLQEIETAKAVAEAKRSIQDSTFNNIANGIGLLKGLFEKNKALQKGLLIAESAAGIAKIIISTKAANAAAKLKYALLPGGVALAAAEALANNIGAGIGIGANIAATAKGLSALGGGGAPSGGSTGGDSGGGGTRSAPNFNVVGTSGQNQIAQTLNREQPPVKAYVVSGEVTTQQSLDRNIVRSASLG